MNLNIENVKLKKSENVFCIKLGNKEEEYNILLRKSCEWIAR